MTHTRKNRTKKRTFGKKDFSSGDGMITKIWGPLVWTALHTISFNYPINPTVEDKKHYKDFIYSLRYVLPCKYCRINLTKNLKQKPLSMCHMKNRETFSRYIYELHELVNKMLDKKSGLTYCDVRERYEHFRSRCTEESPKIFNFIKTSNNSNAFKKNSNKNITKKNITKKNKEKGCTEPLYGKKSKCVINIVPQENKTETFKMDKKCIKKKL
jgi:hypothetical protein